MTREIAPERSGGPARLADAICPSDQGESVVEVRALWIVDGFHGVFFHGEDVVLVRGHRHLLEESAARLPRPVARDDFPAESQIRGELELRDELGEISKYPGGGLAHRQFDQGHVPGARHLPRGQLELRVNSEFPDPTVRIVTCCEFGKISTLAAATLRDLGFLRASALDGGMKAWREAGLALE